MKLTSKEFWALKRQYDAAYQQYRSYLTVRENLRHTRPMLRPNAEMLGREAAAGQRLSAIRDKLRAIDGP